MKGDVQAALEEVANEPLDWMQDSGSAILLHKLGRTDEAAEFRDKLVGINEESYALYQLGQVYAQWGNVDEALHYLNKAHEYEDPGLSQLQVDPLLDPIREDPRFIQMLKDLKFS
jgi:tetratricopeptide (TPR) repeat protein